MLKYITILFIFLATASHSATVVWKQIKEKDGIAVFKGDIAKSPIIAFKGIGVVEAPIMAVTSVLYNIDRKLKWVARIKKAEIIRRLSDFEIIEYNETYAPWPLSNRDFLFKASVIPSPSWKKITVHLHSIEDKSMPEQKGIVRAKIHNSSFILEEIAPKKTKITLEIHADPMGSIPKWLANMFQKHWPYQTLQNIRMEVANSEFTVHPHVKKILNEHYYKERKIVIK